jgi:hypothetical protein
MYSIGKIVERHVGDRQSLELFLDNAVADVDGGEDDERLLVSRKLAFRGTSGIWGVQAAARLNTAIVAPSARPGYVDQATIGGWVDFRRLRSDARWALFRKRTTTSDAEAPEILPIDPNASPDGPMLIEQFCSDTLPPIHVVREPNGVCVYELAEGAVGNTGAFTCVFGSVIRAIGRRRADSAEDQGWFAAVVSAPVEVLQFDVLAHKSCSFVLNLAANVYGNVSLDSSSRNARDRLPLKITPVSLGEPAVIDTALLKGYGKIIDLTFDRCGWDRRDFVGLRYVLEYPPFPSTTVLSFPLERDA